MKKIILWEPSFTVLNKASLLEAITDYLVKHGLIKDQKEAIIAINKRENLGSTLIAPNLAIPHLKSYAIREAALIFVKLQNTLTDWQKDSQVERFIFTIVPEKCPVADLKMLKYFYIKLADDKKMEIFSHGSQKEIQKIL
ncbi:PTS sugar transporter subunit IIA [Liquorilactobacillus satsumensis]|uniref:PTS sugar transporter subunit IIA n=1 Tax=Liquorilactobacillus TaxID=2767888 RepID=UPI0021C30971|nr:PTS sugar transporter subunit IIA [Liquorilactobacillus satsumensis]MCP9311686.1 PTS sugar transporter subunit IIA [Liquorilactobacillus satsumensis]MCP9358819.1 PTS sugar transporter subunit IIA [Liquorilactobacillus satsumensis]